jgi:hypothetical protein
MAKPGRNDPCPCGSGKKYKKCCLAENEAAEREQHAKAEAARAERAGARPPSLREIREAIAANLAGPEDVVDELTTVSNAAVELASRRRARSGRAGRP